MGNTNSLMARIPHVALPFPFQSFKSSSDAEFGAPIGSGLNQLFTRPIYLLDVVHLELCIRRDKSQVNAPGYRF